MRNRYVRVLIYLSAVTLLSGLLGLLITPLIGSPFFSGEEKGGYLKEGFITSDILLIMAITSLLIIGMTILFWILLFRKIEGLGIRPRRNIVAIVEGFLLSLFLLALVLALFHITGTSPSFHLSPSYEMRFIPETLLVFFFLLLYASCEEFMLRGFVLNTFLLENRMVEGILFSSFIFSLMHIANPNRSIMGLVNIFFTGILLSLLFIKAKNLLLPISLHTFWNFSGFLLNLKVSGVRFTIFAPFELEFSRDFMTGGSFGLEASPIFFSAILLLTLLYAIQIRRSKTGYADNRNR